MSADVPEIRPWEPRPDEHNSIQRRVWALPDGHRAMVQAMVSGENLITGEPYERGATFGESADFFRFWSATESEPIAERENLTELEQIAENWLAENPEAGS